MVKNESERESKPNLQLGKVVTVVAGPLCGTQGVVRRIAVQQRIIVEISLLGKTVRLEIHSQDIRPQCNSL